MAAKKLLRLRKSFLYGGCWPFRLRLTDHGADRISSRDEQAGSKMAVMNSVAEKLEKAVMLAELPKPTTKDSIIFFFTDSLEAVFVNFLEVAPNPDRKIENEMDVVIETYLRWGNDSFRRIRSSPRDICIAVHEDGSVECGKRNAYFI